MGTISHTHVFPFSFYFIFLILLLSPSPQLFLSLSAFLFSAGAIFAHTAAPICLIITSECHFLLSLSLLCSTTPVFPRGKLLHMSRALGFMSGNLGFVAATQEMPFAHLSLVVKKTFIFCSQMTVRSAKRVLRRITLPGHCMDSKLKQNPNSSRKQKPICLSKNFGLKCRLLVWHT